MVIWGQTNFARGGQTSLAFPDKSFKWLFRFQDAGETDKYYVETAYGNYWTDFTHNAQIGTRTPINGNKEKITIAKINNTDGHFYFKSETTGVIMDAAGLTSGTASGNVVGWSTTTPTATGGNNDWGIYEVSISAPTASEIYTINNTNSGRGAIMYAPAVGGSKWVWVGGLDGAASFDTNNANFQWIFYPTGKSGQYYLYNVGYQKFIVPVTGGTFDGLTWAFSSDAVPVSLESQSDGTYKIYTSTGSKYISVSTAKRGPVIDYNDVGAQFTITKVADASDAVTTQLTTAVSKLIISQTALTEAPTVTGWYAIRIKTNNDSYKGYIYTLSEETSKSGNSYPLGWYSECDIQPAINNGSYIVKLTKSTYGYYYQMPNGKYIQNGKPFSGVGESSIKIAYTDENHFTLGTTTNSYYFRPYYITGYSPTTYFIGETATASTTYYDIYPISLESADLNAWSVTINGGDADATLTCSRADVSGLSTVYNNGYFFLPTGVTPAASDFTGTGLTVTIDSENKTITAYHYQNLITTYLTNNGIKAKMDLAGTAVGYPKEDATESANLLETYVKIAVNAQYTADVYSELQTRYPAYLASTDIVLPTDGKVYTFTSVQKDGTTIKVYHNTSNNELALTSSALDDGSDKFVCHAIDASQRQFAFVSLNGRYMVGATGNNGKTMSETYSAAKQKCTISKHGAPNDISNEQAYGKVSIKFDQRVNTTSVAVLLVNNDATWNGYNQEGVTDAYSSMFTLTEVSDYYNAVTMHEASDGNSYATVYLPFAATVPTGVRAFYASEEEASSLTMSEITGTIPANTAVVLVSENAAVTGKTYLSPAESAGEDVSSTNKLTGTVTAGETPASGKTMCVFGDSNGPGFYKSLSETIPLGKAVYMATEGSGVKSLNFGTTTVGIGEVTPQVAPDGDAALYDLSGRRVSSPARGIYVRGGRKVVVK